MASGQQRYVMLDALRGAAALLVVVYHGTENLVPMAYAAVDLFFLLSGFVLAHRHGEELAQGLNRREFVIKRVIRLYPLYAATTLAGAIVGFFLLGAGIEGWGPHWYLASLLAAPFFIPVPTIAWLGVFPLNGPAWSLFFELIANAAFTWTGWRWRAVVPIICLSAPLLLWALKAWEGAGGFSYEDFFGGFPRVLCSFYIGVGLYRLQRNTRLPTVSVHPLLIFAAMVALYAFAPGRDRLYHAALIFLIQPALIWIAAGTIPSKRVAGTMTWLGAISYALYVAHAPIQYALELVARPAMGLTWDDNAPWFVVLITVPLAVLAAHWLTFHVDEPARRWLRMKLLPRRDTRRAAAQYF